MIEARDGFGFALEALFANGIREEPRGENLDGDAAVQPGILGAVHLSHSACAELSHHLVVPACSRRQTHFFFNSESQFKTTFTCVAFVSASGSFMQTIFCPLLITP